MELASFELVLWNRVIGPVSERRQAILESLKNNEKIDLHPIEILYEILRLVLYGHRWLIGNCSLIITHHWWVTSAVWSTCKAWSHRKIYLKKLINWATQKWIIRWPIHFNKNYPGRLQRRFHPFQTILQRQIMVLSVWYKEIVTSTLGSLWWNWKVREKAFLKSESRTSVTFKL